MPKHHHLAAVAALTLAAPLAVQAGKLPAFDLADVATVTKSAQRRPDAPDAGFDLYRVSLKTGELREVRVSHGPMTRDMMVEQFRAIGFVGDVQALRSMATVVAKPASAAAK